MIPAHVPADRVVDFDIFNPPGVETDYFAAWKTLLDGPGLVWTTANGGHWIAARGDIVRQLWGDAEVVCLRVCSARPRVAHLIKEAGGASYLVVDIRLS